MYCLKKRGQQRERERGLVRKYRKSDLTFLWTNLRDGEWRGFGFFYSNHTSGIFFFFFLSKKIVFLYGLFLFFFPFFLVSFLKILTTKFLDGEDVAVIFCFWCIVLRALFLNKGLSPYGCIYIERVLYQHRKIWLQMMKPINVFVYGFVFFSIVIVNF